MGGSDLSFGIHGGSDGERVGGDEGGDELPTVKFSEVKDDNVRQQFSKTVVSIFTIDYFFVVLNTFLNNFLRFSSFY